MITITESGQIEQLYRPALGKKNRMDKKIKSVLVIGLGKVGTLAATLLDESGFEVTGWDSNPTAEYPFNFFYQVFAVANITG